MNEFIFTVALLSCGVAVAALWVLTSEFIRRWINNDWCRHEWGKWIDQTDKWAQVRWCAKCNKKESREP